MIYDTTFIRFMHSLKFNNKTPIRLSLSRIRLWYHKQGACYRLLVEFHTEARGKQSCNSWSRRWFVISLYEYFKCANSRAITGDDWASYFILCRRESSCRPAEGHIRWFHNTEGSQTPLTFKQILLTKILKVFFIYRSALHCRIWLVALMQRPWLQEKARFLFFWASVRLRCSPIHYNLKRREFNAPNSLLLLQYSQGTLEEAARVLRNLAYKSEENCIMITESGGINILGALCKSGRWFCKKEFSCVRTVFYHPRAFLSSCETVTQAVAALSNLASHEVPVSIFLVLC